MDGPIYRCQQRSGKAASDATSTFTGRPNSPARPRKESTDRRPGSRAGAIRSPVLGPKARSILSATSRNSSTREGELLVLVGLARHGQPRPRHEFSRTASRSRCRPPLQTITSPPRNPAGCLTIAVATPGIAASSPDPSVSSGSVSAVIHKRGSCGDIKNPAIGAGRAHWELHCKDGRITVSGWVQDTRADGQCVKVQAKFEGSITEYSDAACPKNVTRNFRWSHPGSIVDVYLFAYHT